MRLKQNNLIDIQHFSSYLGQSKLSWLPLSYLWGVESRAVSQNTVFIVRRASRSFWLFMGRGIFRRKTKQLWLQRPDKSSTWHDAALFPNCLWSQGCVIWREAETRCSQGSCLYLPLCGMWMIARGLNDIISELLVWLTHSIRVENLRYSEMKDSGARPWEDSCYTVVSHQRPPVLTGSSSVQKPRWQAIHLMHLYSRGADAEQSLHINQSGQKQRKNVAKQRSWTTFISCISYSKIEDHNFLKCGSMERL